MEMSFSVFEKIDPSCQNGSMEKAKNIPYHQRPYASIAERTLVDISIYSPRPQIAGTGHSHSKISIHSPRAGRDCRYPNAPLITQISIHSPRMGRDLLRGVPSEGQEYFNPLSPHGERPEKKFTLYDFSYISIHSPRMGRDPDFGFCALPMSISIHSPRMGRDDMDDLRERIKAISIHSPRMGRDGLAHDRICYLGLFQSTLPAWGETRGTI